MFILSLYRVRIFAAEFLAANFPITAPFIEFLFFSDIPFAINIKYF